MNIADSFIAPANLSADKLGIRSKVVVIEHDKDALDALKDFTERCQLDGYQANRSTVLGILSRNVDLGAIILSSRHAQEHDDIELVRAIHKARSELPIFLRVDSQAAAKQLPDELRNLVAGIYTHGDYDNLKSLMDTFLFNRHYPNEFVSGVKEFTLSAFQAAFKDLIIEVDPPYIVKDKIIYGELFSLLPLESPWCRGYMTLQAEEENIRAAIAAHKTQLNANEPEFRHVNELLSELANMIWGGFKTRYGAASPESTGRVRVEVPIIINHGRKYISFGADDPQLCFKFRLTDPEGKLKPIHMYQKFIFSLDWSPEKYAEANSSVNDLVSSGDLELF